jgi:hypothetical protein
MARRAVIQIEEEDADAALLDIIEASKNDPLYFVEQIFRWGAEGTILAKEAGPDVWQRELLGKIRDALRAYEMDAAAALRFAVASGHGVGKTTLVAWIILWFISTRPNPQVVVTANTASQLNSKTWRELAKWHRLALNAAWFQWTATKFYFKADPETWFAQAVPWTKERAEAFAGTHEEHVLIIMDEASAIDDAIYDVAEGAMTTKGAMWMAFGNPTRNTGRFRECWRKFRHRWITMQVDSRNAKKANQAQIQAWIEDYGEDSDFVRIRVRGEFPRASSTQFIGSDIVEAAQARWKRALSDKRARYGERADQGLMVRLSIADDAPSHAAKIMTLDVARFGDDESVVGIRQGQMFVVRDRWREKDLMQTVSHMARLIDEEEPDAVFIDAVGLGAGVVDRLRQLGYEVEEVNGALKALDERKYFNRRMEMWDLMRTWLKNGGMIDAEDTGFADDLTAPEFGFDAKDRWQLESKDDMKARGLPSPDVGDALSMSFFMPVSARRRESAVDKLIAKWSVAASSTSHMSH